MMNERHTEVLVVGGALTGLSCALFLAWHGVDCLVVERHPDLLLHPRLRGINPRTVEIYRQLGLEQAIRQACFDEPETFEWHAVLAETLADEHYRTIEEAEGGSDLASVSPAPFGPIDQDKLEMLLREKACALGAEIRFSTELVSFSAGDEGVHAVLRDRRTGETHDVFADYLIGADGVRSLIREHLGIELDGPGVLYQTITAMVEADLTPALRGREVSIAYLQKPQPFTALLAHEPSGRDWVVATGYDPARESPDDYDDERVASIVRAAAGLADVEVNVQPQIRGTDIKVLGFPIAAQLARRFTDETSRVFLAGDAARANPPTGGLGGNTGVQDAHNLAWKLAAVIKGWAGAALLETYEQERRPVAELTMQQAFARFGSRMGHGAEVALIDYDSVVMGYRYRSSAVLRSPAESNPVHPTALCGEPGTRAPHVKISAERSTIDLYGKGFVLLVGSKAPAWQQAARAIADRLSVPLETYVLDGADAVERHGIGATGAVLVRPDGFVAWRRTESDSGAEEAELEQALRSVLSRG